MCFVVESRFLRKLVNSVVESLRHAFGLRMVRRDHTMLNTGADARSMEGMMAIRLCPC